MSYLLVQLHHFELQETKLGHLQVSKFFMHQGIEHAVSITNTQRYIHKYYCELLGRLSINGFACLLWGFAASLTIIMLTH